MNIMLGDVSLSEMEARTGIEWPQELKDFLEPRRQRKATDIQAGKWHCFDMPFVLLCGDRETATKVAEYLKPVPGKVTEALQVAIVRGN